MKKFSDLYLKKLHIGNIATDSNVFMAPMAGYTCYPFRLMCRKLGAGLAFTEMVSANGLKYNDKATAKLLCTDKAESPKAVQLLGSVPSAFEYACKGEYTSAYDIIDINMGCPVPNVIKSGEGCALTGNLPLASKIIESCKRSGKVVTVKFRPGMNRNSIAVSEFARMCEDSGADMITVHGRTRNMMYSGEPIYEYIEAAKKAVNIPVIANGGIYSEDDAIKMTEKTGADGIMIARYGLEDPFIFSRLTGKHTDETKLSLVMWQADVAQSVFDESAALEYVKKLSSYFMKGLHGKKIFKQKMYACGSMHELKKILVCIFGETENQ